jgi:hypothetical protein
VGRQTFPVANARDGERAGDGAAVKRHRGRDSVEHTGKVASSEAVAVADRVKHGDRDGGCVVRPFLLPDSRTAGTPRLMTSWLTPDAGSSSATADSSCGSVTILPVVLDVRGVAADEVLRKLVDHRTHGVRMPFKARLAPADDARLGLDPNEQPPGRHQKGLDLLIRHGRPLLRGWMR